MLAMSLQPLPTSFHTTVRVHKTQHIHSAFVIRRHSKPEVIPRVLTTWNLYFLSSWSTLRRNVTDLSVFATVSGVGRGDNSGIVVNCMVRWRYLYDRGAVCVICV